MVSTLVTATASSAQGAHHGHDSRCVSSIFDTRESMPESGTGVE